MEDLTLKWYGEGDEKRIAKIKAERGERGFARTDWFNAFEYMSFVIVGILEDFSDPNLAHGYSPQFETFEDWQLVLGAIIGAIEDYHDLDGSTGEGFTYRERMDVENAAIERLNLAMHLFADLYLSFWD